MRIAQLANFYHRRSGGLRSAVDHLGDHYVAGGHARLLVIPGATDRWRERPGHTTVEVASPVVAGSGGYRLIVRTRHVRRILEEFQPDVIELSDQTTLVPVARSARADGCRSVVLFHERLDARFAAGPHAGGRVRRRISDAQIARLLDAGDAVVACSQFAADAFHRHRGELHVVPLGVDLDGFRPLARNVQPATLAPNGRRRRWLVTVSRLHPEKRPDLAIDTLRALHRLGHREYALMMIGDGPLRARLVERAADLPVRFVGHLDDPSLVAALLGRCDVALAPGCVETFGLATLEALACGLGVVAADRGANGEVVGDAGVVTEAGADAFAAGVLELADLPWAYRANRARTRAEQFSWPAAGARMLAVLRGTSPPAAIELAAPATGRERCGQGRSVAITAYRHRSRG